MTPEDIQDMAQHWLECPAGAYLGSGYGNNIPDVLMTPIANADSIVTKLREDVPLVNVAGVNVYASQDGADRTTLYVEVAGGVFPA